MAFDRKAYIDAYNKSKYQERKQYNRQWYQTNKAKNKVNISDDKDYHNKSSNRSYHKNKCKRKHIHVWRNILKRTLEYKGVRKNFIYTRVTKIYTRTIKTKNGISVYT